MIALRPTIDRVPYAFLILIAIFSVTDLGVAQGPRPGRFTFPSRSIRSRDIDQKHIKLELGFDFDKQEMSGKATVKFAPYRRLQSIAFDAEEMTISEVTAGKKPLKFTVTPGKLEVQFAEPIEAGIDQEVTVVYLVSKPRLGAHFVIPDASESQSLKMVWTQCEPEYARFWFPCLDTSTDRITSEIIATVPQQYVVLSNGALESKKENSDGTRTWHWNQKQSHVTYLMSVVAGDFEVYEQEWDGIPIQSYVPRGMLEMAPRSFQKTPEMVKFFSQKIGYRYPWPKYAQICVDEYNWGGMEHTSATTLNLGTLHDARAALDSSSDNLVAHELAHQWFGDLLTCKDWAELWLNESFATYFATIWTEHDHGWDTAAWDRHEEANSYLAEDARYRRSIVNYRYTDPNDMFDSHTYPKGGRVLHMLRFELGEEAFWKSIHRYVEINQFRTVETADLRKAISDATGQELNWFFDQWVYKGGHPELEVNWSWDESAKSVQLAIKQIQKQDEVTPLFRFTTEIDFAVGDKVERRSLVVSRDSETYQFPLASRPTRVVLDPRDIVLKTMKFTKSREELLDQLANDRNLLPRKQAVEGLKEFIADPAVKAALVRASRNDPFWAIRRAALQAMTDLNEPPIVQNAIEIAKGDGIAAVRAAAVELLAKHPTDEVKRELRQRIASDKSYNVVATSLRILSAMDGAAAVPDLIAALPRGSAGESILRTATTALTTGNRIEAIEPLQKLLAGNENADRRTILLGALAALKSNDPATIELLTAQMAHARPTVRKAAYEAVAALEDRSAIAALQSRRAHENTPSMIKAVDAAIEKLQAVNETELKLQAELEKLKRQNQKLESRLKALETQGAPK
jgi:aminopeptidase N